MKFIAFTFLISFISTLAFADSSISGVWKSKCIPLPKRHSIISTLNFSDSVVTATTQLFADSACETMNLAINFEGDYQIGGAHGSGLEFDFTPTVVTFTLLNLDVVQYYNANLGCGFSDWKLNEVRNVSGKLCPSVQMPTVGLPGYDIVAINGDSLQFGVFPQGALPMNPRDRPFDPSPAIEYFRQANVTTEARIEAHWQCDL